jgi:hypothetical protein
MVFNKTAKQENTCDFLMRQKNAPKDVKFEAGE